MRHIEKEVMKVSIDKIVDLIGVVNNRQTLAKNLSGGMKRRLSIGISSIGDPKVNQIFHFCSSIEYNQMLLLGIDS